MKKIDISAHGIVFALGFFALSAQTLLLRIFLSIFEGSEFGIACFFSSWLFWVAVGALGTNHLARQQKRIFKHFEFLPLLYLPAYVLQMILINQSRALAGIESYELFPLFKMVLISFPANAPVSLLTGALFVGACNWITGKYSTPVARVYITEAAGSFTGGVMVTIALFAGASSESIILYSALAVALLLSIHGFLSRNRGTAFIPFAVLSLLCLFAVDQTWEKQNNTNSWRQILKSKTYSGTFSTPKSKYLFGRENGQFTIISQNRIVESIPQIDYASSVIALNLAQNHSARKFLVAGPGSFSICSRLLDLKQAQNITWLDTDPHYPTRLLKVLPENLKAGTERINIPHSDIRSHLKECRGKYDVIILNLPDNTNLSLNGFFTREFFSLVKQSLAQAGIVGVRTVGGENYMGSELIYAGASLFHTLSGVFSDVTLKPGNETWMLASSTGSLSSQPAILRDRFSNIEGIKNIYPPEMLMSLYLPERIDYQLSYYNEAINDAQSDILINNDAKPRALLWNLLFAVKKTDGHFFTAENAILLSQTGPYILITALLLFTVLRTIYRKRTFKIGDETLHPADAIPLLLSTGAATLGMNILLMFRYQSVHGSLFLYAGLMSAVFMLGVAASSALLDRFLTRKGSVPSKLLAVSVGIHAAFTLSLILLNPQIDKWAYLIVFIISGLLAGMDIPLVAWLVKSANMDSKRSATLVESCDHAGGAIGGMITGLVLLPMFGYSFALLSLALLIASNLPVLLFTSSADKKTKDSMRPLTYISFGIIAFLTASALITDRVADNSLSSLFQSSLGTIANPETLSENVQVTSSGEAFSYYSHSPDKDKVKAYIINSAQFAGNINGYGGPITLAIMIGLDGRLVDFNVVQSSETPAYLQAVLKKWKSMLQGRNLFEANPFKNIDSLSGATLTSRAIANTLEGAGRSFGKNVLEIEIPGEPACYKAPSKPAIMLTSFILSAILLRWRNRRKTRVIFLLHIAGLTGVVLNTQYSSAHIFSLLSLNIPPIGWNTPFILTATIPLFVILFGNIYCGYLCPFGALQELIGDVLPGKLQVVPDRKTQATSKHIKYTLLFVTLTLFFLSGKNASFIYDPLITLFSKTKSISAVIFAFCLLAISLFYKRFWCRTLCPVGAFLSLLNRFHIIKRLIPSVEPRYCDYGITRADDPNCICCYRCRIPETKKGNTPTQKSGRIFLYLAIITAVLLTAYSFRGWRADVASFRSATTVNSAGKPRAVNMPKLEGLIKEGKLSGREAMYYK